MKSGAAISILDPYEWLPTYGENAVSVESKGLALVIKIEYEMEDEYQTIYCRELRIAIWYGMCFLPHCVPGNINTQYRLR